jgi:riboflavin kinase
MIGVFGIKLSSEHQFNVADLSFFKFCHEKYGINKGVYNCIDAWLYNEGFIDIIHRRKTILSFLRFIQINYNHSGMNSIKFGHGGLTPRLNEYMKTTKKLG